MFFSWLDRLPKAIEPVLVQTPGRGSRFHEHPYSAMAEVVEELCQALTALPDLPWAFYGHSLGARIAFELARELQCHHHSRVCHLFVGAALPPHLPLPHEPIHNLPRQAFIDRLQALYSGIPEEVLADSDLMDIFLPVIRADTMLFETYFYTSQPQLDCGITAFAGDCDRIASPRLMHGWDMHTHIGIKVNVVRGDHFFLSTSEEHVLGAMIQTLEDVLPGKVAQGPDLSSEPSRCDRGETPVG